MNFRQLFVLELLLDVLVVLLFLSQADHVQLLLFLLLLSLLLELHCF